MQHEPPVPARRCLHAVGPLCILVASVVAACGGGNGAGGATPTSAAPVDGTLEMRMFEWGYEPETVVIPEGEELRIVLDNDGAILHNLKIDDLAAEGVVSEGGGPFSGGDGELFVGADAGERGTLTFTPLEAGTYAFYCTISGHRDFGMEGVLVVEPG